MSPNSDNATARFLFAILKQKNLKDINWDLVAKDPVLLDPAPNGHAARMRYSRFKTTMLGSQSSKKTRAASTGDKPRVSKPTKRDTRVKSEDLAQVKWDAHVKSEEDLIKSEGLINLSSLAQFSPSTSYPSDGCEDFRFLTPCSDDMTQSLPMSAAAANAAFMDHSGGHDPNFSAFDTAYDLSGFAIGPSDVQGSQNGPELGSSQALADYGHDWTNRYPDQHPF